MKQKVKAAAKAGATFLGTHVLCCSPVIFPTAFGFAISSAYLGVISLAAIATIYSVSAFVYCKNNSAKKAKCSHDCVFAHRTYLKSKSFKNASFLASGVFLGAVFNHFSAHDHNHHHHLETQQAPRKPPFFKMQTQYLPINY